ncbi:MAG: hypothetical protein WBA74_24425, partial [Cyclobacteriaceae bacterium]
MNKTIGITIARLGIGLLLIKDFIIYFKHRYYLFGEKGILSMESYEATLFATDNQFLRLPFENETFLTYFLLGGIVLSFLFTIGIKPLITSWALLVFITFLRLRNIYILDGADNVIWTMLPFMAFAASYQLFTYKKVNTLGFMEKIAPYAMMIQFSIVYFFAGFSKLIEPIWYEGDAMFYILRVEDFKPSNLNIWLTNSNFFVKTSTYFTLAWELTFPILIWFRKLRPLVLG